VTVSTVPTDLLDGLDEAQRRAVEAPDGPLLIFAGAAVGRPGCSPAASPTLVATGRARPSEILAVTFTNKAVREMRTRVEELVGESASGMWLGTFHSLGAGLLRRDGESSGQGDRAARQPGLGARTLQYGDLVERGIVDPTKVVRSCLVNAASTAIIVLTTEVLIADAPIPEPSLEMPGGGEGHSPSPVEDYGMGGMEDYGLLAGPGAAVRPPRPAGGGVLTAPRAPHGSS
jgi:hypothetical protein